MKIPMAVVGPLNLKGKYAKGGDYTTMYTRGTLAMSMNRGITAGYLVVSKSFRQELSKSIFYF